MENANPFPTVLNPNASAIVRTRDVLTAGSCLLRRFIRNDSDFRVWERHLHVGELVVAQIGFRHICNLGIQSLGSVGVNAAVILGEKRLERVSLLVLVCLPGRFFQISHRALTCSRFRRLRVASLRQANWSSRNYGDTTESERLV